MASIWEAQERINFETIKTDKFKRLLTLSTPENQVYVLGKVDIIFENFMKKPKARPFSKSEASQLYLALIEFLELSDEEREKRMKQSTQYREEAK